MRFLSTVVLCILPALVFACEEVCMNGTVAETLRIYTTRVLEPLFGHKEQELQAPRCLDPLRRAVQVHSPDALHSYIFKGFFHGKCQRNGIEPEGCPNPDCPSRCGTPGSMVHFYSTFRRLAFNAIRDTIGNQTENGSPVYKQMEACIEQRGTVRRKEAPLRLLPRVYANRDLSLPILYMREPFEVYPGVEGAMFKRQKEQSVATHLQDLAQELEGYCGLEAKESRTDLKKCSWEKEMKKFILQYP
ncbi:hypothetical protein V5O48_004793 [Marasmius crinis-equi]|uniref:Uncharacterized protein n=1 Tax=Marasmius crinis-equi TaxID=585013 RepID=A0ABR3FP28_9AGAR